MDLSTAKIFAGFSGALQGNILSAAATYIAMQERITHPRGSFDRAGRFFLSNYHPCCEGLRNPSRAWPYTHLNHARSLEHVCYEGGIQTYLPMVRKMVRELHECNDREVILQRVAALLSKAAVDRAIKSVRQRALMAPAEEPGLPGT